MSGEAVEFRGALAGLLDGREPQPAAVRGAVAAMLSGAWGDVESAAYLVALRARGEAAGTVAAAAEALRAVMVPFDAGAGAVVDTCGTGGDGTGTFNVSTAVALVVAACGARVVKHGNRAVSSKSGSADVLAALGVPVESGPAWSAECLRRCGFAFCFAPHFHPVLARVAPLRRRLGVPTVFNLLGPLANPARADYQLLGVGRPELLEVMAGAAATLGVRRAAVVRGRDGLDEVSLSAPTDVRLVEEGRVTWHVWRARDFGLAECRQSELLAGGPAESAAVVLEVLRGAAPDSAPSRVVVANAAAALFVAGVADDLTGGVALARAALAGGAALAVLESLKSTPA